MTQLQAPFDARSVKPFDPDAMGGLPVGLVPGRLMKETVIENKEKNGHHVEFEFVGENGPTMPNNEATGMTAKYRLNLFHQASQKAVETAYKQLGAIGQCVGEYAIQDLTRLLNKPLCAIVQRQQNDARYTEIIGFCDFNGDMAGQPGKKQRVPVDSGPTTEAPPPAGAANAPAPVWQPSGAAPAVNAPAPAQAVAWGPATNQAPANGFAPAPAPAPAAQAPAPAPAPAWSGGAGAPAPAPAWVAGAPK